jgi:hypothetical protein
MDRFDDSESHPQRDYIFEAYPEGDAVWLVG